MIIPLRAETPNYSGATTLGHFPWTTLAMIAVNVAAFFATGMGDEASIQRWGLEYGGQLHPVQWLTHNFLHGGFGHLIGNMLFLWVFGLVVEGRLGWWKFLTAYLSLGVVQGAVEQSLLFRAESGYAVGASAVIYGLLTMALLWAPETEVHFVWFYTLFGFARISEFEVSILWLAIWYVGLDLLSSGLHGFRLSTELLHALGAALGFGLGFAMLKLKWVDCEGWDLLTVMTGGHMRRGRERSRSIEPESPRVGSDTDGMSEVERFERARKELRKALAQDRGAAALAVYGKFDAARWMLAEAELSKFIDLLCRERRFDDAILLLEEYLRQFAERAAQARLKLAQLLVEHQRRPAYAMRVLAELAQVKLPSRHRELKRNLERKAQKMIEDGVLELEGRAW